MGDGRLWNYISHLALFLPPLLFSGPPCSKWRGRVLFAATCSIRRCPREEAGRPTPSSPHALPWPLLPTPSRNSNSRSTPPLKTTSTTSPQTQTASADRDPPSTLTPSLTTTTRSARYPPPASCLSTTITLRSPPRHTSSRGRMAP